MYFDTATDISEESANSVLCKSSEEEAAQRGNQILHEDCTQIPPSVTQKRVPELKWPECEAAFADIFCLG